MAGWVAGLLARFLVGLLAGLLIGLLVGLLAGLWTGLLAWLLVGLLGVRRAVSPPLDRLQPKPSPLKVLVLGASEVFESCCYDWRTIEV